MSPLVSIAPCPYRDDQDHEPIVEPPVENTEPADSESEPGTAGQQADIQIVPVRILRKLLERVEYPLPVLPPQANQVPGRGTPVLDPVTWVIL